MKTKLLSFAFLCVTLQVFAQVPQSFTYQAVVRDIAGNILASQNVGLRISIHDGSSSGPVVYQETHSKTTSLFGLVNLEIGNGTPVMGTFPSIDWGSGDKFIQTELDPAGGSSYQDMGTSRLLSVPYALHAGTLETPMDRIQDKDGDTKVMTEATSDEDWIRFFNTGVNAISFAPGGRIEMNGSNVTMGKQAGEGMVNGIENTFIGPYAGMANTSGSMNTFIGSRAGNTNSTGNHNILIGYNAGREETGSYKLHLGRTALDDPFIFGEMDNQILYLNGKFGIKTYPMYDLDVNGTVNANNFIGDGSALTNVPGDNLGNHTASQNIRLGNYYLSGDGGNEGIVVSSSGNVGIGTSNPEANAIFDVGNTSNSGGVVFRGGSSSPSTPPAEGSGRRMMWYPKKSAFRAGKILSTEWDDVNIGETSIGLGYNAKASGGYSLALGSDVTASGSQAIAIGSGSSSSGTNTLALGLSANASGFSSIAAGGSSVSTGEYSISIGFHATSQAYSSFVTGRYNIIEGSTSSWIATDPLFVIGNGTSDFSRSNALTVLKNGKIGIGTTVPTQLLDVAGTVKATAFQGDGSLLTGIAGDNLGNHTASQNIKLGNYYLSGDGGNEGIFVTSSGNVGIGTISPNDLLELKNTSGNARMIMDGTSGNSTLEFRDGGVYGGSIGYNITSDYLFLYEGGNVVLKDGTVGIGMTNPNLNAILDVGNTSNSGGVVFRGGSSSPSTPPAEGAGYRMMWYPDKYAFRSGYVSGTQWDNVNIGGGSFATGYSSTASGNVSFAAGDGTVASGDYSVALGRFSEATGNLSTAIGYSTLASGGWSTAMGYGCEAIEDGSTAVGWTNIASGNDAFASGWNTEASGWCSFSSGQNTTASGSYALSMGYYTIAQPYACVALGRYNIGSGTGGSWVSTDPVFIIGNGASDVSRSNAVTVLKNGNVGIGTVSPSNLLHISGGKLQIGTSETLEDGGTYQIAIDAHFRPLTDDTRDLGNASYRWDDVYATNGTIQTSDLREKDNIENIHYGLQEVLKMKPVSFTWKNKPQNGNKLGLIAQDMLQIIPEAVKTHDWETDETSGIEKKVALDRWGIYYADLIPVLVKAIQEQQTLIEELKTEINMLKSKP